MYMIVDELIASSRPDRRSGPRPPEKGWIMYSLGLQVIRKVFRVFSGSFTGRQADTATAVQAMIGMWNSQITFCKT